MNFEVLDSQKNEKGLQTKKKLFYSIILIFKIQMYF